MNTLPILAVLLLCAVSSQALKCSTCDKEDFAQCDAGQTEECDGKCRKIYAKVGGYGVVTRTCTSLCAELNKGGIGTFCCDTDMCNKSTVLTGSIIISLCTAFIAKLMMK